jgi:hypothetical protein
MLYRNGGLGRSIVILSDPILTMQSMRLARESGIYSCERFADASSDRFGAIALRFNTRFSLRAINYQPCAQRLT